MIDFLIKSTLCLTILYIVYKLLFERENMHVFKRFYLLFSLLFSLIIPFISLEKYSEKIKIITEIPIQSISLSTVIIQEESNYSPLFLGIIYVLITTTLLFRFIKNLMQIRQKIKFNSTEKMQNSILVLLDEEVLPHTFMKYIFISKIDYENRKIEEELYTHELTHVCQKHTLDILFVEILKTFFWFNPIFFLYKKAIQLNHEFLADETVVVSHQNVSIYQQLLLSKSFPTTNIYLTSNLNSFLKTKKRFIMMTKTTSIPTQLFKKAIVVPVFLTMFFLGTSVTFAQVTEIETTSDKNIAVPKDPKPVSDVYVAVEKKPEFPGGIKTFYEFVGENFKVPVVKDLKGRVLIQFIIEKDGSLTDIKVIRDIGHGTGEEAVRVLKLSPKWIPGEQDGKPVRVQYSLPISVQS